MNTFGQLLRFAVLPLTLAAVASAGEIHGVVLDGESRAPIPDAIVRLMGVPPGARMVSGGSYKELLKTHTGPGGGFRVEIAEPVKLERLRFRVEADGYVVPPLGVRGFKAHRSGVDPNRKYSEVELLLYRANSISGRVVDDETREPLAGLQVTALRSRWYQGGRVNVPTGKRTSTDADGRFLIDGLPSTEYYLEFNGGPSIKEAITTDFTKEETRQSDLGYPRTYWPGGLSPEATAPLTLSGGEQLDLGDIVMTKRPAYQARVSFANVECDPSEEMAIMLFQSGLGLYSIRARGRSRCGAPFLVKGLVAGRYQLMANVTGRPHAERVMATAVLDVLNDNLDVELSIRRGVDISGQIELPDSASPKVLGNLEIRTRPVGGLNIAGSDPPTVDAEGAFRLVNLQPRDYRVRVTGIPPGYFVQQMVYNETPLAGGVLRVNPFARVHKLGIVLSDKPATLTGRVIEGDEPVTGARVVLAPWPADEAQIFLSRRNQTTDEEGRFRFQNLPAGDYRLVAVYADDYEELEKPHVLANLAGEADEVTLSESGAVAVTVTLELQEP